MGSYSMVLDQLTELSRVHNHALFGYCRVATKPKMDTGFGCLICRIYRYSEIIRLCQLRSCILAC